MKEVLGEEMNVDDQDDPAWIELPTVLPVWMLLRTVLRLSDLLPRMEQSGLSLMSALVLI